MRKLLGSLAAVAFVLLFASPAFAGTATSNMAVSASVSANCTISAGTLAFGAYDPIVTNATAALDGTATLTVDCTTGSTATITLGQGLNPTAASTAASPAPQMIDGTNKLAYFLYSDSGRTTVWGNAGVSYTGTGTSGTVTVYGAVTAGQNEPAGSYTDTVVATITF